MHGDNQSGERKASTDAGPGVVAAQESKTHQNTEGHVNAASEAPSHSQGEAAPKWFLRSKTVLGAIVGVLPHVLSALGYECDDAEIQNLLTSGTAFLMAILVVWGRATASRPIAAKPVNPYDAGRLWLLLPLLILTACATKVRDKNGVVRMETFSDADSFAYQDETTTLTAARIIHSEPIKAASNGTMSVVTALGAAATTGGVR